MLVCILMGLIGNLLVGTHIMLLYLLYFLCGITFYSIHRLGHTRIFPLWYKVHVVGHHLTNYPPSRFLSDGYLDNLLDITDTTRNMYLITAFFDLIIIRSFVQYNLIQISFIAMFLIFMLIIEDKMHYHYHLRNSYLNRYEWFQKLRWIHYLHHKGNMKQNYAIKDFLLDWLSGNLMLSF
jgi:hypothetical protein